jgi:hypothetical protein
MLFTQVPHKIRLGEFNAKLVREDIFKSIAGKGSLYEDSKITMFPYRDIHTCTLGPLLMGRIAFRLITY